MYIFIYMIYIYIYIYIYTYVIYLHIQKQVKMFSSLKRTGFLAEKQMKYFTYELEKPTNFGKLYLLPKVHKRIHNVPGRPVISNCERPTGKCSEFLDHHLKPVIQNCGSYIKDTGNFINKTKNLSTILFCGILFTADVVGLYPSMPYEAAYLMKPLGKP